MKTQMMEKQTIELVSLDRTFCYGAVSLFKNILGYGIAHKFR